MFLIVDGTNLAHRAYFALKSSPEGLPLGPVVTQSLLQSLLFALRTYPPTHLAIVFDSPNTTFRHLLYAPYKEGRQAKDEALSAHLREVEQTFVTAGLGIMAPTGFEADDVIATLNQAWGREALIYSGDRDLWQLVTEQTSVLYPGKVPIVITPPAVSAKMGVSAAQVSDYKALRGDKTDNIPGVKGIGKTIAIDLLSRHQSVETIYAAIGSITGRSYTLLKQPGAEATALLSKKLARLVADVPNESKLADFSLKTLCQSTHRLAAPLQTLGLWALAQRYDDYLIDRFF